jgi:hypothetical protein
VNIYILELQKPPSGMIRLRRFGFLIKKMRPRPWVERHYADFMRRRQWVGRSGEEMASGFEFKVKFKFRGCALDDALGMMRSL